jgi:hypothetical protein
VRRWIRRRFLHIEEVEEVRNTAVILITAVGLLASGCSDGDRVTAPEDAALFEVEVQDQTFRVRVQDEATVDALEARMEANEDGVILGTLAAGDGGFNQPWSWHLLAGTIEAPDVAVEVCDGTPSMVENDLGYWLDTVGRFCPWSARVVTRID